MPDTPAVKRPACLHYAASRSPARKDLLTQLTFLLFVSLAIFVASPRVLYAEQAHASIALKPAVKPAYDTAESNSTCKAISTSGDRDIQTNARHLIKHNVCYEFHQFSEHGHRFNMQVFYKKGSKPKVQIFLPHDNEDTAQKAALLLLATHDVKIITIHTAENRFVLSSDPNRILSTARHAKAACRHRHFEKYTKFVEKHMTGKISISAHNNTNFGASLMGQLAKHYRVANWSQTKDPDNFMLVSFLETTAKGPLVSAVSDFLVKLDYNVVMEPVTVDVNDCSFSNYMTINKDQVLINVEAEFGDFDYQQQALTDVVNLVAGLQ